MVRFEVMERLIGLTLGSQLLQLRQARDAGFAPHLDLTPTYSSTVHPGGASQKWPSMTRRTPASCATQN